MHVCRRWCSLASVPNDSHSLRKPLILGSASPRRRELLHQLNIEFEARTADIDEQVFKAESPAEYVIRLAIEKARALMSKRDPADERPVLAADTAVVVGTRILGKPAGKVDAISQLQLLSDREHKVLTAVALATTAAVATRLSVSHVKFRKLDRHSIETYWETGEPADKAGSYGIQGLAAVFISEIRGSYTGIMGLPLFETAQLLESIGYEFPAGQRTL